MFDVVAANQHQTAASIDCRGINHRQARLTATRGPAAQSICAEAAHQPGRQADQRQYHQKGDEESCRQRHSEEGVEHYIAPSSVLPLIGRIRPNS